MAVKEKGDIYAQLRRNRLRLAEAVSLYTLIVLGLSAVLLRVAMGDKDIGPGFWFWLSLLWLVFLLYALLRYALGGYWIFRNLAILPPGETDIRLSDALDAAALASGMRSHVRLLCIPNSDINAFSLSLPDGTFALFATSGIAEKLPERERVALMAHEIAHMMAGDAALYTVMLRLTGRRAMRKMVRGAGAGDHDPLRAAGISTFMVALAMAAFLLLGIFRTGSDLGEELRGFYSVSGANFAAVLVLLLALFAVSLPSLMHKLLQLLLDRRREFAADLQASYLTRDPEAVYLAVRHASEDVRDVMILPACFDALLFHPMVDYTSYNPFATQPTMGERMKRLSDSFPTCDFTHLP